MQRFPEICSQKLVFGKNEIKPLTPSDSFTSQSGYSFVFPNHNRRIGLLKHCSVESLPQSLSPSER